MVREAFGLSSKEKLLLDERLYAKSWKTSKEKTGEGLLEGEDGEQEEEEEEEEEEEDNGDGSDANNRLESSRNDTPVKFNFNLISFINLNLIA